MKKLGLFLVLLLGLILSQNIFAGEYTPVKKQIIENADGTALLVEPMLSLGNENFPISAGLSSICHLFGYAYGLEAFSESTMVNKKVAISIDYLGNVTGRILVDSIFKSVACTNSTTIGSSIVATQNTNPDGSITYSGIFLRFMNRNYRVLSEVNKFCEAFGFGITLDVDIKMGDYRGVDKVELDRTNELSGVEHVRVSRLRGEEYLGIDEVTCSKDGKVKPILGSRVLEDLGSGNYLLAIQASYGKNTYMIDSSSESRSILCQKFGYLGYIENSITRANLRTNTVYLDNRYGGYNWIFIQRTEYIQQIGCYK